MTTVIGDVVAHLKVQKIHCFDRFVMYLFITTVPVAFYCASFGLKCIKFKGCLLWKSLPRSITDINSHANKLHVTSLWLYFTKSMWSDARLYNCSINSFCIFLLLFYYNNVFCCFFSFFLRLPSFVSVIFFLFLVGSFDGLVASHCSLCSLANKLCSFVRSIHQCNFNSDSSLHKENTSTYTNKHRWQFVQIISSDTTTIIFNKLML